MNVFAYLYFFLCKIFEYTMNVLFTVREDETLITYDPLTYYINKNIGEMVQLYESEKNTNSNICDKIYDKEQFKDYIKNENEEERKWKTRILFETVYREDGTPTSIIMFYDLYKQGFTYYADDSFVSYKALNAAAMKYVNTFFCKDFFIDTHFMETHCLDYKSPLLQIFNEKDEKKKTLRGSHLFAQFKRNKPNKPNEVSGDTNKKTSTSTEFIKNKFIHLGKLHNFSFLKTPPKESSDTMNLKTSYDEMFHQPLSYKDFKQKQKQQQGTYL